MTTKDALARFNALKPSVEGTDPNSALPADVMTEAIAVSRALDGLVARGEVSYDDEGKVLVARAWFRANRLPTQYREEVADAPA